VLSTDQPPSGCVELGSLLRAARRARGLSQTRAAALTSSRRGRTITRNRLAQWEHGHRRVSAADLHAFELALNIEFTGVDRGLPSQHHAGAWCELIRAGDFVCRTTGAHL
jgi:transcriptional regulator with XRE-family HTH domain